MIKKVFKSVDNLKDIHVHIIELLSPNKSLSVGELLNSIYESRDKQYDIHAFYDYLEYLRQRNIIEPKGIMISLTPWAIKLLQGDAREDLQKNKIRKDLH